MASESDRTFLTASEQKDAAISGQYGSFKATSDDMEMEVEDDTRVPLTRRQTIFGCFMTVTFSICACSTLLTMRMLGTTGVPSLELVALGFGIQTTCATIGVGLQWRKFVTLDCNMVVWLFGAGLSIVLALASIHQAGKVLPPGCVGGTTICGMVAFSLLIATLLDWSCNKGLLALGVLAAVGSGLYIGAAHESANEHGFLPVTGRSLDVDRAVGDGAPDLGATFNSSYQTVLPLPSSPGDPGTVDNNGNWDFKGDMFSEKGYAYFLLVISAGLLAITCSSIYRHCYGVGIGPLAFVVGLSASFVALAELFVFADPVAPWSVISDSGYGPFFGFVVFFQLTCWSVYLCWLYTEPAAFALISPLALVLTFGLQYAMPSLSLPSPMPMHWAGVCLTLLASIGAAIHQIVVTGNENKT